MSEQDFSDAPSLRESPGQSLSDLKQRIRELEAALHPFAAYAYAQTAYCVFHRGTFPPDSKSMAYVQTEMGDSGNITWGDFKLAHQVMPRARHGGESAAKRWQGVSNRKDGSSPNPSQPQVKGRDQ